MKAEIHNPKKSDAKRMTHSKDGVLVALTKNNTDATAVLTFSVGEVAQLNANRVQLLPDGKFKSTDGRPANVEAGFWLMDPIAFEMLKTNAELRKNDFMFDYEHQTLNTDTNGKPAPAAGWFSNLEYVPGEGLFAVGVNWTTAAAKYIADKEYRYVSAVFAYDVKTGRPMSLQHAALTNEPALDGMKALAALKSNLTINSTTKPTGENTMNEAFLLLLSLLGVAHDDVDLDDLAVLKKLQKKANEKIAALKTKSDKSDQLQTDLDAALTSVTALKAKADNNIDLSKYVPKETYDATVSQLAALKVINETDSVEQLLKDNADKVHVAESQYLTDFGKQQGVAALKEMLSKRPSIAALKSTQTKGKEKPEDKTGEALNSDQIAVCKAMNITEESFKKQLTND